MNNSKILSKTFCILPWIHLSTRPDGSMRVCCTANASSVATGFEHGGQVGILRTEDGKPNNLNVTDFLTAWNSSYMRNVRRQMLNDEKPRSCMKCFKEEESGHNSKRMWETAYWSQRIDVNKLIDETDESGSVPPNLAYIDLRFGTKCQLACVMCSPHDSSGWVKDWKAMFPAVENESLKETMQWKNKGSYNGSSYNWHKQNPMFWKQFYEQIPNMQQIYFAGGESLIIEEHYEILEECIKQGYAKNLELRYNSNGVEWRDDLFDLWKEFKIVRFHYSVDDIFDRNEYIRYPSKWSRTEEVFRILDEKTSDNVEVTVACAVQALNIYYLPDFVKWKVEQNFRKINMWPLGAGMINYHFVYHPAHLNVKILPTWFKQEIRKKYKEFELWMETNWSKCIPDQYKNTVTYDQWRHSSYGLKRLDGMLSFMESEDWSYRLLEMKEFMEICDKQRNLDWKTVFPEMKDIFR
jgi:hypothetical protein